MKTRCITVPTQKTNIGIETVTIQFSGNVFDLFHPKLSTLLQCKTTDDYSQIDHCFELKTPINEEKILKEIAIFAATQNNPQILIQWIYQCKEDHYFVCCNIGGSIDLLQVAIAKRLENELVFSVKSVSSKENPKEATYLLVKYPENNNYFHSKEIGNEKPITISADILKSHKKLLFKLIHEIISNQHQAFYSGELMIDIPTIEMPALVSLHKDFLEAGTTLSDAIRIHAELTKYELLAKKLVKVNAKLDYLNERIPNTLGTATQSSIFSTIPESLQSELRTFCQYTNNHKQILLDLINKITNAPDPDNIETHHNLYALTNVYIENKIKYIKAINQREYQKKLLLWALYQTALNEFKVIINDKKTRSYKTKIFNEVFSNVITINELGQLSPSLEHFYEQFTNKSLEETIETFKKHLYWKSSFKPLFDMSILFTYSLSDKFYDFYYAHPELKKSFSLKSNGEFSWETEVKQFEIDMKDAIESLQTQTKQTKTIAYYNSQYHEKLDKARKEAGYSESHKAPVRKQKIATIHDPDESDNRPHKSSQKAKPVITPKIDKKIFANLQARFALYEKLREQKTQAADLLKKTGDIKDKITKYKLGYLKAKKISELLLKITNDEKREELRRKLLSAEPNFSSSDTSILTIETACRKIIEIKILGESDTNTDEVDHSIKINQILIRINRQRVAVEEEYSRQNVSLSLYLENNKTLDAKLCEITHDILQQLMIQSENLVLSAKTKVDKINESIMKRKQTMQNLAEHHAQKLNAILEDSIYKPHFDSLLENMQKVMAINLSKHDDENIDKYFARIQPIMAYVDEIKIEHDHIQRIYENRTKTEMKLVKLQEQIRAEIPKVKTNPIIAIANIPIQKPLSLREKIFNNIGKISLGIAGAILGAGLGVGLGIFAATCTYGVALPFLPLFIIGGMLFGGAIGFLTGTCLDRRTRTKANQQKSTVHQDTSSHQKISSRFAKAKAMWKTQEKDVSFAAIQQYAKANNLLTPKEQQHFDHIHDLMDEKITSDIYQQSTWRETIQQDIAFFNGCKAKYEEQHDQIKTPAVVM